MKLSFSTLGCPEWDIEKIAEMASIYGFHGVELRVKGRQHIDPALTDTDRKYIRNLFEKRKVEICCLSGYSFFNSGKKEELENNGDLLMSYIDLAVDVGAPFIRTFIGDYALPLTDEDVIKNAAYYLNLCGAVAEKKGVRILVETHDSFSLSPRMGTLMEKINNGGVAVLWDIHHTCRHGEQPAETYQALGRHIRHLHIKDADGEKLRLTGEGALPIQDIIGLLKKEGYKGYLSLEWEKTWIKDLEEPEVAFPKYIEYMRRLLQAF
jgi:sugar phosphate isomerase/epimerase